MGFRILGTAFLLLLAVAVTEAAAQDIVISKSFTDDPVPPGGTVTLEFTIENPSDSFDVTDISFTDDLDAALSGLVAVDTPVLGCEGTLSGTSILTFTGGSLAPGASCMFTVTLQVPPAAELGAYVNATSTVMGARDGVGVNGASASDDLDVSAPEPDPDPDDVRPDDDESGAGPDAVHGDDGDEGSPLPR